VAAIIETFLNPVFPVFAIMLLGIIMAKGGLFDISAAQAINKFVFFVVLPALVFSLVAWAPLEQVQFQAVLRYFLAEACIFLAASVIARFVLKCNRGEAILLGMASCFVNHVLFILPIATILYGEQATVPITAIIFIDTVFVFGAVIAGLEIASHRGESMLRVAQSFLKNPVLIAIFLGLLVNISGIALHPGIRTFTSFAGSAVAPAALFSLGIILAEAKLSRIDAPALLATTIKIVVHPILVWLLLSGVADLDQLWHDSVILTAAGPCGAMPFVLALQYKVRSESIGLAIIYSTVASLVTLSIIA
jgi:malonate transporter